MTPSPIRTWQKPHRVGVVLTLAILGWALSCAYVGPIFSIIAYFMARNDLADMDQGRMDPTGKGATQAAHILSLIMIVLCCVGIVLVLVLVAASP